jgi:hypothetical protein
MILRQADLGKRRAAITPSGLVLRRTSPFSRRPEMIMAMSGSLHGFVVAALRQCGAVA